MIESRLWKAFWVSIFVALLATASILTLKPILSQISLLPDQGAAWYYWKLPEQTFWGRFTAWSFYLAHQLFFWGLIWWGQSHRDELRDRNKLHTINIVGLAGMAGFAVLHYLQTAIWYDGLAQDTSVFSSQVSVILLLVAVLLIEAPRRGLFFGYGGSWLAGARSVLIRYHGYYFAWAVTYTYWFHPMETTFGHLLGFFYTFLLMIQGALAFTRVHTNRWWTLVLEVSVLVHGVLVAWVVGQEFWPMFFFGFSGIFIITQMHGLGWSKAIRGGILFLWLLGVILMYQERGWENLNEIARIPAFDYLLVAIIGGGLVFWRRRKHA